MSGFVLDGPLFNSKPCFSTKRFGGRRRKGTFDQLVRSHSSSKCNQEAKVTGRIASVDLVSLQQVYIPTQFLYRIQNPPHHCTLVLVGVVDQSQTDSLPAAI